ncbi:MAG: Maf family protein [Candidatus Cloacimonas sp.]
MIHKLLRNKKVILASASPRRKEIFALLGISAYIIPADINEIITQENPEIQAKRNASQKADVVKAKVTNDALIVAADTLVAIDSHILGKPSNEEEASKFLKLLAGKTHFVYTSLCIDYNGMRDVSCERTLVHFANLSDAEINAYIETGEPMDKAGAYGIQGYGAQFIEKVDGCYFNVMGFPVRKFYEMLTTILQKEYNENIS